MAQLLAVEKVDHLALGGRQVGDDGEEILGLPPVREGVWCFRIPVVGERADPVSLGIEAFERSSR